MTAAKGSKLKDPTLALAKLVAFVVLHDQDACVSEGPVPLFTLKYVHERHLKISESWAFTNGLLEQSISFWMHLIGTGAGELWALLGITIQRGDADTRCLARVFC